MPASPRLTVALLSLASWPFRVLEARATLRRLAALDARALADIGLTPADVCDATALPLAADPGLFLAARVDGKRAAHVPLGARPCRIGRWPQLAKTGS
jgi:uncharacterized protein YjiS (DUF1127 family)